MASPEGTTQPVKCSPPVQISETTPAHSLPPPACVENGGGSTHFFIDASTLLDEAEFGMPSPRLPPAEQVTASFHKELSFDEPTRPKPVPRHLPANAGAHGERQPIAVKHSEGSEDQQPITIKHGDVAEDRQPITIKHGDVVEDHQPIAAKHGDASEDVQPILSKRGNVTEVWEPINVSHGDILENRETIMIENGDISENVQTISHANAEVSLQSLPISGERDDFTSVSQPIACPKGDEVGESQPTVYKNAEVAEDRQAVTVRLVEALEASPPIVAGNFEISEGRQVSDENADVWNERQLIRTTSADDDSPFLQERFDDLGSHLATLHLSDSKREDDPFALGPEQATRTESSHGPLETRTETSHGPLETVPVALPGFTNGPLIANHDHRHVDSAMDSERMAERIPPRPTPRTRLPSNTNQASPPPVPVNNPIAMETTTKQTSLTEISNPGQKMEVSPNQMMGAEFFAKESTTSKTSPNQRTATEIPAKETPTTMIPANRTAPDRTQNDVLSELAALLDSTEHPQAEVTAPTERPVAEDLADALPWQPDSWSGDTPPCPPASLQPTACRRTDFVCHPEEAGAFGDRPFVDVSAAQVCPLDEASAASLPHVTSTPPGSPLPFARRPQAPPLSLGLGGTSDDFSLVEAHASGHLSLDDVDGRTDASIARGFVLHDAASRSEEERRQGNAIFQTRPLLLADPVSVVTEPVVEEAPPPPPPKRPCGFFVDLAELPSPEAPPPPPARADAGHALFSMFIDFAPPAKPRNGRPLRQGGANARDEPMAKQASAAKPIESQRNGKAAAGPADSNQSVENQPCRKKPLENVAEVNAPVESVPARARPIGSQSDLSLSLGSQTGSLRREFGVNESDEAKARRPRLACVSDSDSPLPRRRSSTSSRQPSHRHSWNPDAVEATGSRKHRRASSLSHSLTEDTSSSLSATVELGSATIGTVDVSTSRTFSASGAGKGEVSIVSDTISEGRMITEEEAQDLTDVDEIAADAVASATEASAFVKLSDMDSASPVPAATHAPRMTQSIPEGAWPSTATAKPGMSRSVQGGCSRSLGRLFPHLMTSSAEESELSDASLPSSMHTSAMEGSTEESGGSPATRLGEDLLRMFLEEISPDVTLDVGGRRIRAHKCILASRCQYFAAVLSGGWVTSAGDLISLQGFSYNAVFFALCHIYSGTGDVPDAISLVELATLADMLALEGLKEVVSMALRAKFCHFFHKPCAVCSVGVVECLPLAAAYGLDDIYRRALRWIAKHFVRIWPTKGFAALPRELVEKCYQQIVVHMSAESVLETVLGADKLLATLPSARWAEPVFALASQLLDSAVRFAAHHLGHVLNTPSFQSLGGEQSWNIGRLEESLVRAADRMPPEQACLSVARLDSWLNDSPTVLRSATYTELLRRLSLRAEARLVACGARSLRAASWQRVPLRVRERVAAASNIDLEAAAAAAELAAAQRRPQATHRSLTGSRHLDLRQVKLAMTQQARRAASGGRVSALTNDSRPRRQPVAVIHPRQVTEPRPLAPEPRPLVSETRARPPLVEVRPPPEAEVVAEARPVVEPSVIVETRPVAVEARPAAVEVRPAAESRLRETRVNGDVRGRRKLISSSDSSRAGSPALHRPARATAAAAAPLSSARPADPRPSELDMSTDSLSSPRTAGTGHSPHSPLLPPCRRPRAPLISPRESHTSRLRSAAAAAKAAAPAKATPVRAAPAKATPSKATPLRCAANKAAPAKVATSRDTPTPARANRVAPLKGPTPKRAGANPVKAVTQALGSRSGTFLKDEPSVLRKPSAN